MNHDVQKLAERLQRELPEIQKQAAEYDPTTRHARLARVNPKFLLKLYEVAIAALAQPAPQVQDPWRPFGLTVESALNRGDDPALLFDENSPIRGELRRLLASPPASPPGWVPIETAPKDGTLVLLGARNGVWVGKYQPVYTSGYRPANPWSSHLMNHDHMAERHTQPTHWMHLPAAPHPPGDTKP